jgi:hypothetical protein
MERVRAVVAASTKVNGKKSASRTAMARTKACKISAVVGTVALASQIGVMIARSVKQGRRP